ncbi:hypothetical protein Lac2_25640 [Claveliimonas bilis]|uniref:polysaccharide pyruvyl transferase family protein n=1 Tax=Claveliimonas bilis TaxID=3028070 RepID=UPI00292E5029|nr:polysaccharide pyruvyl transferase family protein [Claveliimonas bilis]BDZ84430.1 hypothetical protein Lac2_25640 [Claveliimonas bilis]
MKVGLLTWHQAVNHGAVLQAYATQKNLESFGCETVVLDYDWSIYDNKKNVIIKKFKKLTPNYLVWRYNVQKFFKAKETIFHDFVQEWLNVSGKYYDEEGLDAVLIGSDMVFDIIEGYNPFMYGKDVPCNYIFSYAASFGYTTTKIIENSGRKTEISTCLSKLKAIGYRDQNTKELIDYLQVTTPTTFTIDPVLAYGFNDEVIDWDTGKWRQEKYLLIYSYQSNMDDKETIRAIKRLAREEKLRIISLGYYHSWCDDCINVSPVEMLEVFKYAKYIITDTFHGTVFSLILHKKFASIIRGNGFKLQYLLDKSGMKSRIALNAKDIPSCLQCELNYDKFDEWLEMEREKSLSFIKNNLIDAKGE